MNVLAQNLALLATAATTALVSVRLYRLERSLADRDSLVDRTIGEMRATMREYAEDVEQIYAWAQGWAAEDEQADRRADERPPVDGLTAEQAAAEQAAQIRQIDPAPPGEPGEVLDAPPATSEAWPPPVDDPPTTEIPRVGAHRTDARATRAAGRALREGADEETTR